MEPLLTEDSEVVSKLLKDSMFSDIDALLVKLHSSEEESLLITANGTTIHILGSEKGKDFLVQDEGLAMRFHKFCFGDVNVKSEVEQTPSSRDQNIIPEVSDVIKPKRKRGRPPKVAKKLEIVEKDEDPHLEEDDEITEEDITANTDNSEAETECKVTRSGRRVKRKTLESLGYVSLEKKKKIRGTSPESVTIDVPAKSPSKTNVSNAKCISQTKVAVEEKDEEWKESTNGKDEIQEITEITESLEASGTENSCETQTIPKKRKGHHICQTCGEKFSTQELIENHLRINHPEVWSKILEEETDILVSLGKHDTVSESPKRKEEKKSLAEKRKEEILYDCQQCEGKFKTTKMLEKHVELMHADDLSSSKRVETEDQSSDILDENEVDDSNEDNSHSSNAEMRKIVKIKKKMAGFNPLSVALKVNERTYKIHDNFVKGSVFKCYTCEETFDDIAFLIKHMKQTRHDGLQESSEEVMRTLITVSKKKKPNVYKCSHCRVEYFIKENCLHHIKENNCQPVWKRNCPMRNCDLIFDNNNFFMNHMETFHETTYPFFCQNCNKTFQRIREFESHRNYHRRINNSQLNPSLPVMCNECGLRFPNNFDLKQHKLDVHEANKKFKCEVCDRKFRREDNMKIHLRTHKKREDDPELQCKICQKYLCSKDSLKLHTKYMHSDEKPCVCEICGHRTRQMGSLQYHMKVRHSDERPYECEWEGCNKSFKIYQVWQSHSQNHALAIGNIEKAKSYGRLHHCDICFRYFNCRTDMSNHMLIHSNEKSIKCEICQTTVKRWGSLKRHMMNVHNKVISGGLSAMKMQEGESPRMRADKRVLSIRKPKTYHMVHTQVKSSPMGIPDVTILKQEPESVELEEADYQTETTYELQNSDAQEQLLQILANASSDITKIEQAASSSVNPAGRDFVSEANSQTEIMEEVKEYQIEETTDEVCLDSAGEQVIYLNSLPNELVTAQDTGGVIYAIRNSDGSLSLQLSTENS